MNKQVDRTAYRFESYCGMDRWASYHYQLKEIIALAPATVLEVGLGDGVLKNYLRENTKIEYSSIDIADDLGADIQGDVRNLPLADECFDAVCAFEVLEHLPFEDFETALAELFRVTRKHVLISLPHFGPPVKGLLKIPFLPEFKFALKIPFARVHNFNGQHYWEIGKKGYPNKRIRTILKSHGTLCKEFIPFENQYHHFFILEKRLGVVGC